MLISRGGPCRAIRQLVSGKNGNPNRQLRHMKVRELVEILRHLPDQEATVVIGEGSSENTWLIVTGVVERLITISDDHPDFAGPGREPGIEIV